MLVWTIRSISLFSPSYYAIIFTDKSSAKIIERNSVSRIFVYWTINSLTRKLLGKSNKVNFRGPSLTRKFDKTITPLPAYSMQLEQLALRNKASNVTFASRWNVAFRVVIAPRVFTAARLQQRARGLIKHGWWEVSREESANRVRGSQVRIDRSPESAAFVVVSNGRVPRRIWS